MTNRHVLVKILNVPFSAKMFNMLLSMSIMSPNLAIEAQELYSGREVKVKLFEMDFDWPDVNIYNEAA
jgi:hypothetical protein